MDPSIEPLGDSAALVAWDALDSDAASSAVQTAAIHLDRCAIDGIHGIAPAFKSISVWYDCRILTWKEIAQWLSDALRSVPSFEETTRQQVDIPVCYDAEFAFDLTTVAAAHDLNVQDVIQLHSSAIYRVQMIGFSPGFPYLAGLPRELHSPRRDTPRTRVPAGSVAIGGEQSGIYSHDTPGGWQIIGRTPVRLFDPQRNPPCLLQSGDVVRFIRIDRQQFADYAELK
ncbi:MAG: 5-oxoprolinase subunit PxpB [Planctomycetaceae bacterium]|nr:5-oxoprolinase subunit PxpB [Planctomycetaceae bacterium]